MMLKFQCPNKANYFALRCHLAIQFNECALQYENKAEIITSHLLYYLRMNPHHFDLPLAAVHLFGLLKEFPCQK